MKHRCPVPECAAMVPEHYFMCRRHWALVPPEVRKGWSITLRQYRSMPTPASARATIENRNEVVRIVAAIERGEAA